MKLNKLIFNLIIICYTIIYNGCCCSEFLKHSPRMRVYDFPQYSCKEIYMAVKQVFKKHPDYKVNREKDSAFYFHYWPHTTTNAHAQRFNSDSSMIYFNLNYNDTLNIKFWTCLRQMNEWDIKSSDNDIVLLGLSFNDKGGWHGYDTYPPITRRIERSYKPYIKKFENEIIYKIRYFLDHPE